jgi:fumarylacetoacetase
MSSPESPPGWDNDHFTLANIPYGIASAQERSKLGVATRLHGNVYFLDDLIKNKLIGPFSSETEEALSNQRTLNAFISLPQSNHHEVRSALKSLFGNVQQNEALADLKTPIDKVKLHLPLNIGDFSDFSCSRNHVLNAGEAVLGVRSLPPGFLHFPVGYTGRSSSIVVSGTPVTRPWGQTKSRDTGEVSFGPSKAVDFELEVAAVVARSTKLGERVKIADADEYIFGLVLLNDWSGE